MLNHSHQLSIRFQTQAEESVKETKSHKNSKHFRMLTSTSLFSKNRPYIYSKTIPKSLIDEGNRSKSILSHMNLLSNESRIKAIPSRRERERTILFTDNMEIYHNKMIKRIKETNRRRSCWCQYCGMKTKFEKKNDDFEVRTQQAICSDLKLLQFTRAGQKKKQTIIKEFKIKQINEKKIKSQQETTNSQIQINLPSTQRESLQIEKIETDRNKIFVRNDLLKLLPSVKSIVSLTILKQIYITGKLQKLKVKKPSHDYLIMKTYNVK